MSAATGSGDSADQDTPTDAEAPIQIDPMVSPGATRRRTSLGPAAGGDSPPQRP